MARKADVLENVSNDGAALIELSQPYIVSVELTGVAPILFHRWSVEGVETKAGAAKGSKAKKTDDVESYIYRNQSNELCIPGEYVRMSVIGAAKFRQDPRSPRKSAMDLFKAGIIVLTELCSVGKTEWDYIDRRRVCVQRNGITRSRPALNTGWKIRCELGVQLPEYIPPDALNDTLQGAGRLIGLADFRPTYGRFQITDFCLV